MKKTGALALCLFLVLGFQVFVKGAYADESRRKIAATMEAATVWIVVETEESYSVGSGFVVGDGWIATNAHVVDEEDEQVRVYVVNERIPPRRAKIVSMLHEDEKTGGKDFALLRFEPPKGVKIPVLTFNFDVKRMDRVSAWGYPGMVTQYDSRSESIHKEDKSRLQAPPVVYTEGAVNTIVRDRFASSIIHSAAIAGGNSGGPLVNERGEVVGMNTWGSTEEGEGAFVNAALPAVDLAYFLLDNGVTPKLASGQKMPPRPGGSAVAARAPASGGKQTPGRETREERRLDLGSFSVLVPRGWSVLEEEEDMILVEANNKAARVRIICEDLEGQSLQHVAWRLSKKFGGTKPELDDDSYVFTFVDKGVETTVFVEEGDEDDQYMAIFLTGDAEAPGVEKILNSIEQ